MLRTYLGVQPNMKLSLYEYKGIRTGIEICEINIQILAKRNLTIDEDSINNFIIDTYNNFYVNMNSEIAINY